MTHKLLEALLVYTLVALSAAYCLWALLPAGLKQRAAAALQTRFPGLQASRTLQALARPQAGCGSGCGSCASKPASARPAQREHKIELFRRH
jgi:hypothetical protein